MEEEREGREESKRGTVVSDVLLFVLSMVTGTSPGNTRFAAAARGATAFGPVRVLHGRG